MSEANEVLRAYQHLPLPLPEFAKRYWLPLGAAAAATLVVFHGLLAPLLGLDGGLVLAATVLAVVFFAALAALLPVVLRDRRRVLIDHHMHLYITHLGVLSTSNLPRNELLRTLAQRREYGPLAEETGRVLDLVEQWNVSLPQACVLVARGTPSKIYADFLERMAHILETSGDLETFLRHEQQVVLKEYASVYQGALYGVENLKELYLSLMMSGVFMVIFALLMPPLTGSDAGTLTPAVLAAFVLMEALMVLVLHFRAPPDRVWTDSDLWTEERLRVLKLLPVAAALSLAVGAALWFFAPLPKGLALALGGTPMLLAGIPASRVETLIRRREANFPAFLRSLGASVAARGGGAKEVLKRLARNDFGPLTPLIKNLHRRLSLRLDETLAWRHFSAETGSRLVNEFTDMFVESVRAGGRPHAVGDIISDNFLQLGALRRSRYQSAAALRGMLLGLTAAMSFTLFVGLEVVGVLGNLFAAMPDTGIGLPFGSSGSFDVAAVHGWLLLLLLLHALLAAAMVKRVDGGAWTEGCTVFVALLWVGALAAEGSHLLLRTMFNPGGG